MSATVPAELRLGLAIGKAFDKLLSKRLLIPLAMIGSCGALASVPVYSQLREAQTRTAGLDAATLRNGVELYQLDNGKFPEHLEDAVPKYVKELHWDPWGNRYSYVVSNGSARVISSGPDGILGNADDIQLVARPQEAPAEHHEESVPTFGPVNEFAAISPRSLRECVDHSGCRNMIREDNWQPMAKLGCPETLSTKTGAALRLQPGLLQQAGFRHGDLPVSIDGASFPDKILEYYGTKFPDSVDVRVLRDGKLLDVIVNVKALREQLERK